MLWSGGKALLHCAWHGQSLKTAYSLVTQKVDDILLDRYQYILDEALAKLGECKISEANSQTRVPKVVWFSWLQGMEQAPDFVKVCLQSQRRHLADYEFRIVDLENYHNWVQLPQYVEEKFRKGLIPPALFSDLLRLALLKQYGGVWMDASVYCSGFGKVLSKFPNVWAAMPRANSNHSILLGSALGKDYQEAAWQDLIAHVSIHKMNYRKVGEAMENPNSYCNHIMNEGC